MSVFLNSSTYYCAHRSNSFFFFIELHLFDCIQLKQLPEKMYKELKNPEDSNLFKNRSLFLSGASFISSTASKWWLLVSFTHFLLLLMCVKVSEWVTEWLRKSVSGCVGLELIIAYVFTCLSITDIRVSHHNLTNSPKLNSVHCGSHEKGSSSGSDQPF